MEERVGHGLLEPPEQGVRQRILKLQVGPTPVRDCVGERRLVCVKRVLGLAADLEETFEPDL
jgi:hypothetical protein